jgi:EmrB/QacA subfamily drug resistance transporter
MERNGTDTVARKWVVLSNTTIGTFMASLDGSIVLISLPTIGRELPGADPAVLLWVVLTYSLVTTTLLLSLGRLSDMYGRVRLYTAGFAVFTVGSLFASISFSGAELLAARVVQGVGAGFLWSNSAALLTDAFPVGERGRALGINQVAALSGSMMGLVLGGVLTATLGWRSIFWVNLPIGTFGTLWAYLQLREMSVPESDVPIDWAGNTTFGVGLTLLLAGLTFGALGNWGAWRIQAALAIGLTLLVVFVLVEMRSRHPMFDLSLFRIRTFVAGNMAAMLSSLARGAFMFMMVFYLQGIVLLGAFRAGILLLPLSIAFACTGPISGAISDRRGARALGTVGLLVSAAGFVILLQFPAYGPYDLLAAAMVLLGVGQGMFASPNRAEVMSSVPASRRGVAAAIGTTMLNAGNLGSLAIGFTILAGTVPSSTLAAVFAGQNISTPIDAGAFMSALHIIFAVGLLLTLAAAVTNSMRGQRGTGRSAPWGGSPSRVQDGTSASK